MTVARHLTGVLPAIALVLIGVAAGKLLPERPWPAPFGIFNEVEAIRRIDAMREQIDGLAEDVARARGLDPLGP